MNIKRLLILIKTLTLNAIYGMGKIITVKDSIDNKEKSYLCQSKIHPSLNGLIWMLFL